MNDSPSLKRSAQLLLNSALSFGHAASLTTGVMQEAGAAAFEPYQGLLYMTEDYKVYGYITCTRVKLLITVDDTVRACLRAHTAPVTLQWKVWC